MNTASPLWVEADLRLLGRLTARLFLLLNAIQRTGSINQAAKAVGMTYKGAWEMIERANNLAPRQLVTTITGGPKGGGTRLTQSGQQLLTLFEEIEHAHTHFLQRMNQRLTDDFEVLFLLKGLIMKASARNQLFGRVVDVSTGTINASISIGLKGGETLVATVTKTSAEALMIQPELTVVALIKASHIMLISDFGGFQLSARNQLKGVVSRIQEGPINAEVIIDLKGGDSLAATVTHDSIQSLGLVVGSSVTAVFKAGSVIIGVPTE